MIEIITSNVIDFFTPVKQYIFFIASILSAGIALISSMLTCMGITLPELFIRIRNWRNRKVVKYRVLSTINDKSFQIKTSFGLLMDILEIYLALLIMWVAIYLAQKATLEYSQERNLSAYILLLMCMLTIIFCGITGRAKDVKKSCYYLCSCIIGILLGNCFEVLLVTYFYVNNYNISYIILFIFINCSCSFALIEMIYRRIKYNFLSICRKAKKIRVIRSFGTVLCIMYVFWNALYSNIYLFNKWIYAIFLLMWIFLCFLEDFYYVDVESSDTKVEFMIQMENSCDKVKSKIYQYKGDKVKYELNNGYIKIIDSNEIVSIDYVLNNYYVFKKNIGICFLKNGDIMKFDGYKFIQDSWVSFYKIEEDKKYVRIVSNMRIKEIISETL